MPEVVTLELPDSAVQRAREVAVRTQQPLEDVLTQWIDHAAAELPITLLTDEQVLQLCDLQMDEPDQNIFSDLLALNQEGALQPEDQSEFDRLMTIYRHGLVRKGQALKEAVARGLIPPLN